MASQASRKVVQLSETLTHKLNWYALAAMTASVSALAITPSAEAKIIYTKTNIRFEAECFLDLNNDYQDEFLLTFFSTSSGPAMRGWGLVNTKNVMVGYRKGWAAAFPAGRRIPRSGKVYGGFMALWGIPPTGEWAGKNGHGLKKPHYLGLKFVLNGKIHYGWARLTTHNSYPFPTATLLGYAYETVPKKPIITGKTQGPDVVTVPMDKAGTLGYLALGRTSCQ